MTTLNDFRIEKKLGDGAFSQVYSVTRISDKTRYALKKVKMGKLSEKEKQNALNEIRILASIQHPNVIGYKEAFFCSKDGSLCIIMEIADGGDLLQDIEKRKKTGNKYNEKEVWHFFIQIVRGLKALHDLKIIHRDIKCANLFLTKDGVVKLGDLNVSKVAKKGLLSTQTGTPYYASPEVWLDKPYDNKSDVWSLGCVLYEMVTLLPPFRAQSMAGLAQKVTKGNYERIPAHFSPDLSQMIRSCLQVVPANRPTLDKILVTPGLLNHVTSELQELDIQDEECDEQANLLKTIRCPRNLNMVTASLPAPQYQPLQRSKSLAVDIGADKKLSVEQQATPDNKNSQLNLLSARIAKLEEASKQLSQGRAGKNLKSDRIRVNEKNHVRGQLPTIQEDIDQKEEDTLDKQPRSAGKVQSGVQVLSKLVKKIDKLEPFIAKANQDLIVKNIMPPSSARNLVRPKIDEIRKHRRLESAGMVGDEPILMSGRPQLPNSADVQLKAKAYNLAPSYQKSSDQEDVSTRVSSKSQAHRNIAHYGVKHSSKTPQYVSGKAAALNLNRLPTHQHVSIEHLLESERQQNSLLPLIKVNSRVNSVDYAEVQSRDYDSQGSNLAPSAVNSRYRGGNRKNEVSAGMSRAMGMGENNRYAGVNNAIRIARQLSREALQPMAPQHLPRRSIERGPCPSEYKSDRVEPSKGLQAIYASQKRMQAYRSNDAGVIGGAPGEYSAACVAADVYMRPQNKPLYRPHYGERISYGGLYEQRRDSSNEKLERYIPHF